MTRLHELLHAHNWRTLRAICRTLHAAWSTPHPSPRARDARFDNRWTKSQAVDHVAALLLEPANVRRTLAGLPADAREALDALLACDGRMPAHRFLAHFGPLRPYRPWRADSPRAPWRHPASPAERLWFLGLIFRHASPQGKVIAIPDELRALLPAPSPPPSVPPAGPPLPVPDPILDVVHLLAYLNGHDVHPVAGRWISPRHFRTLNTALSRRDPSAATARSELQTGYLRFLHYLAQAAGLLTPVAGLLKPTPAAWDWLDDTETGRWQVLWQGWQTDLGRPARDPALWSRFRLPAARSFVRTALDALSLPPGAGWWNPSDRSEQLRARCISQATLPPDGDVLAPLQDLILGPLTWTAMVRTDADGHCAFTPRGRWLLDRSADPPQPPLTRSATLELSDSPDHDLAIRLPQPPARPPLRPLVELPLAPQDRLSRRLTRPAFVAALAHGFSCACVVRTLSELTGSPLQPAVIERLEGWEAQARALTLRRMTVMTAADPCLLAHLSTQRTIRPLFRETLSPHHVAVEPDQVARLLRALRRRDHTPLVEPGVVPPPPASGDLDAGAMAYVWLALRTYVDLADLVDLPAVPPARLLDRLAQDLSADQQAAVAAQARRASRRLRDAIDGYTPFPAPLAGFDHAAIRATIERALQEGRPLEMVYHTAGRGERTVRVVEPLRLEEQGGALYLVAYCRLRQAERVFRVDRIESAEVND